MKTYLDCIPCFLRQALEAARLVSGDKVFHQKILRDVLRWAADMEMEQTPPTMAQRIHRRVREVTGIRDPYAEAKRTLNRMAMELLPELRTLIASSNDPLVEAIRLAVAGNVLDMGVDGNLSESSVLEKLRLAATEPLSGNLALLLRVLSSSRSILYLADNAGEIVLDRLLIEQLDPSRVTVVVRGYPVLNDATWEDARDVGLTDMATVIGNGSDAPGTILNECNDTVREFYKTADLVIAKGQGNYETLSEEERPLFFLFKAKCPVIAGHAGIPVGTHVLAHSPGVERMGREA